MSLTLETTRLPSIVLGRPEHARLSLLADAQRSASVGVALLAAELDRARVVAVDRVPGDVVTMGTVLQYVDPEEGNPHTVTLVYPHEADIDRGRISVTAPLGAALIGLRVGDLMRWRTPGAQERRLQVLRLIRQARPTDT